MTVEFSDGTTADCFPNAEVAADTIAHELGHYLGLEDSSCSSYIMSSRRYSLGSNGQFQWLWNQEVQSDECSAANQASTTPAEGSSQNPTGPLTQGCEPDRCTPIVLDLDAHGFRFTSLDDGVLFDIDADGQAEHLSWTAPRSREAFLVLDRNGNGQIDDGSELFGDATAQPASEEPNGFAALSVFDQPQAGGNGDGAISPDDAIFSSLRLWIDVNHDGRSQASEITALALEGIQKIELRTIESGRRDRYGNQLRWVSHVHFAYPGRRLAAADVILLAE